MNREFSVDRPERYAVRDLDGLRTPRILFYAWALAENRDRIGRLCGGLANARPMVKTFKSSAILQAYCDDGLTKVKASCVEEARVIAERSAVEDILVAFPCMGPAAGDFLALRREFPRKHLSVVVPNVACARALAQQADADVPVYLDIDPGMKRTGVAFGRPVADLADAVSGLPHLRVTGLHVYDGNIHHPNACAVRDYSTRLMDQIDATLRLLGGRCAIEEVVTSSSLTMEWHMATHRRQGRPWYQTASPGTAVLWDSNYNDVLPGAFEYAAAVATRVVDVHAHRDGHTLTTDCGIKLGCSVDSGPPHVLGFSGYRPYGASERFGCFTWLGCDRATGRPLREDADHLLGRAVLVFPRHVCTTVNQYAFGYMVREGALAEEVAVDARDG